MWCARAGTCVGILGGLLLVGVCMVVFGCEGVMVKERICVMFTVVCAGMWCARAGTCVGILGGLLLVGVCMVVFGCEGVMVKERICVMFTVVCGLEWICVSPQVC